MAAVYRKPCEFCWINMLTPQPTEALAFFKAVLGWNFFEMPGMGYVVQVGGSNIGGLFDLDGPNTPPGCHAHIGVMVKVESADAIVEKVVALGGRAKPAFDIGGQGRMAVCSDPNGAEFDVWEPKAMLGTDVDRSSHGAPSWFETMTTDVDLATRFYSELFGWTSVVTPMPDFDYTSFQLGDSFVAGLMPRPLQVGDLPSHWATYFTVNDPDDVAREAIQLGGQVHVPLQDIPDVGRFCGITSPQGVKFYVIKYSR